MNSIDKHWPLLSWLLKVREAGWLPSKPFVRFPETKAAYQRAKQLYVPKLTDAENPSDIAAGQFQMGQPRNMHVAPMKEDIDHPN